MEQAERRRKLAAKRREKVLRGGKSRLDYITGKVDEPPPKSRVAKVGPSTSDGETKRPDALETVISNASTARPTVSEECPAERTAPTAARHEAVEREGDRASAPKVATTVARSESRVLVYIRRLLPCVLALVYYAHVSSGYALGTSQSAIALARSAPAWFITYEAITLPLFGAERPRAGGGGGSLLRQGLDRVLSKVKWHLARQAYEDWSVFQLSLICIHLVPPLSTL